jgi:hypothetical protein
MVCRTSAGVRVLTAVGVTFLLAVSAARAAPPEDSPATISFTESIIQFASSTTSVAAKACWGAYVVYVDVGPTDQVLVYHEYVQFEAAYPSPGFFALIGAATDRGVIFFGVNVLTRKTQLMRLDLGPLRKGPVYYDLDLDTTQGIILKGNGLGDYAGASVATGKLFTHWHGMPDDMHVFYTQPTSFRPSDLAYGWNSWYFANSGGNSLARVSSDGVYSLATLPYTPLSIAYGPSDTTPGVFRVTDRNEPAFWDYHPIKGTGAKTPLKALTAGLQFTSDGMLLGFQLPRTIMVYNFAAAQEISYPLKGTAQVRDYVISPGRYPWTLLVDEFDASNKGMVVSLQLGGLAFCRELVSGRREGEWMEPVGLPGRLIN